MNTLPALNLSQIIADLTPVAFAVLTAVAVFVGNALRAFITVHTSARQQATLAQWTLTGVQAAEQKFGRGTGPLKLRDAMIFIETFAKNHAHITLTQDESRTLVEAGVNAFKAGVSAVAPGTATLLPMGTATSLPSAVADVTPPFDAAGFKADLLPIVIDQATMTAKGVIRDLLGAGVAAQTATPTADAPTPATAPVHAQFVKTEEIVPGSQVLVQPPPPHPTPAQPPEASPVVVSQAPTV